jgi:hypothetical protein
MASNPTLGSIKNIRDIKFSFHLIILNIFYEIAERCSNGAID